MTKQEPKDEPITEMPTTPPDPKDYWAIYAHTTDWQILLHRMVAKIDPNKGLKPLDPAYGMIGYQVSDPTHTPIWYLSRQHFPVSVIAALIGKDPAALEGIETLHLREFKDKEGNPAQKNWQTPNVEYWGMG